MKRMSLEPLERRTQLSDGDVDLSLGGTGRVSATSSASTPITPSLMAVAADGAVVAFASVTGAAELIRWRSDGTLDPTLDGDGRASLDLGFSVYQRSIRGIKLAATGTIYAYGNYSLTASGAQRGFIARFTASGQRDPTFGSDGVYTHRQLATLSVSANPYADVFDIALTATGAVVGVGVSNSFWNNFADIFRLTSTGVSDSTFGTAGSGRYSEAYPPVSAPYDIFTRVAIDSSGRIVTTGGAASPLLRRFLSNGTGEDGTFSAGSTGVSVSENAAVAVVNGKIVRVFVGREVASYKDVYVARYNSDGTLDTGYGNGGVGKIAFAAADWGNYDDAAPAAAIASNGEVDVLVQTQIPNSGFPMYRYRKTLVRLTSSGSIDALWGSGGRVTLADDSPTSHVGRATTGSLGTGRALLALGYDDPTGSPRWQRFRPVAWNASGVQSVAFWPSPPTTLSGPAIPVASSFRSVAPSPSGGFWAYRFVDSPIHDSEIFAYRADGSLDTSFGQAGKLQLSHLTQDEASSVRLLADGDGFLVICGTPAQYSNVIDSSHVRLVRYSATGVPDARFGTNGETTLLMPRPDVAVRRIADGRILVAGWQGSPNKMRVAHLTSSGQPDLAFSGTGIVDETPFVAGFSVGNFVDLQLDSLGRLVALFERGVWRFFPSGLGDPSFGAGGAASASDFSASALPPFRRLTLDGADRVVIAAVPATGGAIDAYLFRFDQRGRPDVTFSGDGILPLDLPALTSLPQLATTDSRQVLLYGHLSSGQLTRVTEAGALDPTHGTGTGLLLGTASFAAAGFAASPTLPLVTDSSGRVLISGSVDTTTSTVVRLSATTSLGSIAHVDVRTSQFRVDVTFNRAVRANTVSAADLAVTREASSYGATSVTVDPSGRAARFFLPQGLPAGTYSIALKAASVEDSSSGQLLPASTVARLDYLPGDATLDAVVNFDDLLELAASYGSNRTNWYGGDFNWDGRTNFDDLLILAANYNTVLPSGFAPLIARKPPPPPGGDPSKDAPVDADDEAPSLLN